ncbi:MAG: methyltransferase domain-containing protein [Opitutaceae bacterium]|jgi:SAM-dependent methyltransferase|nr:methyltransferase domain-containing protein [Opitutaceae bacterium]
MTTNTTPDDLSAIYARRFDSMREYRNQVWRALIRHFFQRHVPADAAVLDLGCGYGEFINNITAREKFGMDLNPDSKRHLNPGVKLLAQDCSTRWPLADGSLDIIFTSNFFEHLPDKTALQRTLAEARRCLKSGGRLIAMGPNIRCVPGAYWDFWDHYLPLTELSLAEGLQSLGFEIVFQKARFLPYTMSRKKPTPPPPPRITNLLIKLYLRIHPAWRIFGKQFLVIAGKR